MLLDQSAVFTCETDGDASTWTVNGTLLNVLPPEIRDELESMSSNTPEGSTILSLTIPARAEYNGTTVQCLAVNVGAGFVESAFATLTIIRGTYDVT